MRVELLACTPDAEKLVAASARLCYSKSGVRDIESGLTPEKTAAFIDMLTEAGHDSPLEHASFTFGIEGVSRSLLAQITRHRIASFSVQSQRYVDEGMFEYVIPPEIAAIDEAREEFIAAMQEDQRHYERLTEILAKKHVEAAARAGRRAKADETAARRAALEDARFVLPNACTTKFILTINCRSLLNFFSLRCCGRAQWEIRMLANEMLRLVRAEAPRLFAAAGPGCLRGPCREGKMSCGRAKEMREFYKNLAKTDG
ncbi:MAG: FAD-dependent thymidylate synthase [Clostridia bacterium]|nr:FAD-dependent thymidylate synthase [Clostridia bacterium]